jgi:hypothetical protein
MHALSLVLLALLAQATPPSADPDAKAKAQAQVLLKEGAGFYQQGAFADALTKFQEAYVVFPSPKLLFNIGQANRELGRDVDAVLAFEKFLSQASDASPSLLSEARRSVNEIAPKIGKLLIDCSIVGAEVTVDGRNVGKTPLADLVLVSAGSHQVTATHPSTIPVVQTLTVAPGTVQTLVIRPQSLPGAVPVVAPAPSQPVAPAIDVAAAKPPSEARESRGWWLGRKWTWVAAGSTVAFVAVAAIAGSMMQASYDDLRKNKCGTDAGVHWTGCSADDISSLDTKKNIANVFWGLSAAAAVTTGVLFFVEGRSVTVSPMAGGSTGLLGTVRY